MDDDIASSAVDAAAATAAAVLAAKNSNTLKRKSGDIGWEYGKLVDKANKDRVQCNFCKHINSGGINRFKNHIAQTGKGVIKCDKCPEEAKLACLKSLEGTSNKKKEKFARELGIRNDVHISSVGEEEENLTCVGSSAPHNLGPIDKWTRAIDPSMASKASLQQQKLNKALWDERTLQVKEYIEMGVYTWLVPSYTCPFNHSFTCTSLGSLI
ncbi:hypothetical protein LINGRAPRIM_LOCUS2510 [Linum grandiflorum]